MKTKKFQIQVKGSSVEFLNLETNQTYQAVFGSTEFTNDKEKVNEVIYNSIYFRKMNNFVWLSENVIEVVYKK